jgi:hypothetical protein
MGEGGRVLFEHKSSDGLFSAVCQEQDGVVIAVHSGRLELGTAEELEKKYRDLQNEFDGRFLFFLDMTAVTKVSAEARIHSTRTLIGDNSPFRKWATMSGSFVLRTMVNMHAKIAQVPIKDFKSRDEAIAWLRK